MNGLFRLPFNTKIGECRPLLPLFTHQQPLDRRQKMSIIMDSFLDNVFEEQCIIVDTKNCALNSIDGVVYGENSTLVPRRIPQTITSQWIQMIVEAVKKIIEETCRSEIKPPYCSILNDTCTEVLIGFGSNSKWCYFQGRYHSNNGSWVSVSGVYRCKEFPLKYVLR